jgi:ABC-type multidrug transport system permease subunit
MSAGISRLHALAAAQGPPDPAPLALPRGDAHRLPGDHLGPHRPGSVARPGQADGRDRQRAARRADELLGRRPASRRRAVRQRALQVRQAGGGQDARGGGRQGALRRGPRRARRAPGRDEEAPGRDQLAGTTPPTVEVLYNGDDPIRAQLAESTIKSRLADANKALSDKLTQLAAQYLRILLKGGDFSILGQKFDVLGLERSKTSLEQTLSTLPPDSQQARNVKQVIDFAQIAIENLGLSDKVLAAVGQPLAVKRTVIAGHRTTLDAFAVAVSVTVSLMFVTVLLASGMLALEREEHAFGRLVRGLVSRLALLGEKVALAAACAFVVTLVMLCGIGIFVTLDWGRFALWLAALAGGAVAFGALGVAIGALAREVRAASLLAFLLTLPIAFLALVPAGTVATWLYDVIRGVSALFPFRPALQAVDAALNGAQPGLGQTLAHLAVLAVAYLALARVALARFQ